MIAGSPSPVRALAVGGVLAALLLAACGPSPTPPPETGLRAITLRPTVPTPSPTPTQDWPLPAATPVPPGCTGAEVAAARRALPAYQPGGGSFVTLGEGGFLLDGKAFVVRGVDYYPARFPWQCFPLADLPTIEQDFATLKAAHANTVRLFVRHAAFFICPDSGAVPDASAFLWLDSVMRLASAYGLRVIPVLNDLPDFDQQPIYEDSGQSIAQTTTIVSRYRDEPAVLAWDLRDAGDADYTPSGDGPAPFTREQVQDWLARAAAAVRQADPRHPITAGWANDSEATISLVDVVSFQHFGDMQSLRVRVAALRQYTAKPLLLAAFGFSTSQVSEIQQAQGIRAAVRAAEGDHLAGWLVWTMYDFPLEKACWPEPCAGQDGARLHFGLWRADGSRKAAAVALATLARRGGGRFSDQMTHYGVIPRHPRRRGGDPSAVSLLPFLQLSWGRGG
jgi:hypothetical protein